MSFTFYMIVGESYEWASIFMLQSLNYIFILEGVVRFGAGYKMT
jgi:hypothetical protein